MVKKDIAATVEKIGVFFERLGAQPAMGRIFACLLVAEPSYKTFEQIQEELKLSKSAVSNTINMLLTLKMIEYFTLPGDRKRYFQINIDGWVTAMIEKIKVNSFEEIIQTALNVRTDKYPEFNQKLTNILAFTNFINSEVLKAVEKWNKQHA